jgi:hypothetical protein
MNTHVRLDFEENNVFVGVFSEQNSKKDADADEKGT